MVRSIILATLLVLFGMPVYAQNHAPELQFPIDDQIATEDVFFSFQFPPDTFVDIDQYDNLTYSAVLDLQCGDDYCSLPPWLEFDSIQRRFEGTADNQAVLSSPLTIRVIAEDLEGLSASTTFTITVLNTNNPPFVEYPIPPQSATEGTLFQYTFPTDTFIDIDLGDVLTYSATIDILCASNENCSAVATSSCGGEGYCSLPDWLNFNSYSRTFIGTPNSDASSPLSIRVVAEDNGGLTASTVFLLTVESVNEPPVANAGADVSVYSGVWVYLDGSASYDDNTASEDLEYFWTIESKPLGSSAMIEVPTTSMPSFFADLPGNYSIALVVTDGDGLSSDPDEVLISSQNLPPTADAGADIAALVGEEVTLDGTGSTDPNNDDIDFNWFLFAWPEGSASVLAGETSATPSFTPDLPGQYTVQLVVSDSWGEFSDPDDVIVSVIAGDIALTNTAEALTLITELSPADVTTKGNQRALGNFLTQVIAAIQNDDIEEAIDKLGKALERTDGCVLRGEPDGNGPGRDWIIDCAAQEQVYQLLIDALDALYL